MTDQPKPPVDVARLAELRARSDMRMSDRHGPNWREVQAAGDRARAQDPR